MRTLDTFMELLCGNFTNAAQYEEKKQQQKDFPYARHVNTICNEKIRHLPDDFSGIFLIEESYYTIQGKTNASSHLFLFTQEGDDIVLTSYELPNGYDKATFTYANVDSMEYDALRVSKTFTPAHYHEQDGVWVGGSVSHFSPVLTFTLAERFSKDELEVEESMMVKGKKTFGFDEPIRYQRISDEGNPHE